MKPGGPLIAKWQAGSARFAALQPREKVMVVGATVFAILFGGHAFWIEPAQLQKARLAKTVEQQRAEQAQLSAQLAALAGKAGDPDAANRAALERLQQDKARADDEIGQYDRWLVPPQAAANLLQTLLARHRGLTLVSLTTLPVSPLVAVRDGDEGADVPAAMAGNLYKHGIEIRLRGSFHELLAYVAELEGGPQKLLWGGMRLTSQYPVSELTLTIYTLSGESAWLVV